MASQEDMDIQALVEKYEEMLISGKQIYLDADEFEALFDYYDTTDDIESAKDIVASGLTIHPDSAELQLRNAKLMTYDFRYKEALGYINKHFSSYDFDVYMLKIECLLQLDIYKSALELTEEVLNDENQPASYILSELGSVFADADYFAEAIIYLEKCLEYEPDNMEAISDLAYAYEMKGDFEKAIFYTNIILDFDPYSFEAWLNMGKLYSIIAQFEKAIDALDFALSINDSDISALTMKAHCLSLLGQFGEAIQIFWECLEQKPNDPLIYSSLIDSYMLLEEFRQAFAVLDKWEEVDPDDPDFLMKKINVFIRLGKIQDAEHFLAEAKLRIHDKKILLPLQGEIYFQKEHFKKAEKAFRTALKHTPDDNFLMDRLSVIDIVNENYDEALSFLEYLKETNDDLNFVQFRMAFIFLETGNKERLNELLDEFSHEQLKKLLEFFIDEDLADIDVNDREALIAKLNDISDLRLLFKNLKY